MIKSFCIYRTPFLVTSNVNSHSFVQKILPADCGIIAGFNQIFGKEILARFQNTANFHPSLLPYYRGPVPSYWCIKNGETRTGYTLHKATERIDDGEILFQEVVPIDRRDNPETLDQKIAQKASLTLIYYLDYICKGKEMQKIKLNAAEIYKNHAGYLSFPG